MPTRPVLLGAVMFAALLSSAGCSTISRWKQEHRAASLHRQEEEEAADAHGDPQDYKDLKLRMAKHDAQLRALQVALASRSDPDSLAASALFSRAVTGYSGAPAIALAARAVAAAPSRADLLFIQLQLCETSPQCDAAPLEAHLLQLDPQNGAGWTYALQRADRLKDQAGRSTAFYGLAATGRVDVYWNQIVSHSTAAATGVAGFDAGAALTQVVNIESALTLAVDPISRVCFVPNLQADMREPCRQVATAFRQGDTAVVEAYGSSLAQYLWPAGSPEGTEVAAERRRLRYRVDMTNINKVKLGSPQATRILAGLVGHYPSEQATYRALYQRFGLNPEPPDNWKDPTPGR